MAVESELIMPLPEAVIRKVVIAYAASRILSSHLLQRRWETLARSKVVIEDGLKWCMIHSHFEVADEE